MSCLMHHKFILIDAVAKERGNKSGGDDSDSSSDDDDEDEEVSGGAISCDKCALMMASESVSGGNVPAKQCVLCRPLRIRSKEDLIKFPSETLPRLPKHGLLITGSHNWSQQVRRRGRDYFITRY